MIFELYDALKAAGVDLTVLKWMVGFNLAISVSTVMLLLRH
ncbi:MAG TPA: hypothetical protein VGF60_05640 [Xanthobacteraceae bacterium]